MSSNVSSRRVKLRRGDLFEFCAADGRLGYGVVLRPGGVLDAAFFRTLHAFRPTAEVIAEDEIALIGTTMDALFYHGRWTVIGHDFSIPDSLPFPNWKVNIYGKLHATDFEGKTYWPIRDDELDLLDFKSSRSPIGFQKALEALNGIGEWREDYEALTPAYARRRITRT